MVDCHASAQSAHSKILGTLEEEFKVLSIQCFLSCRTTRQGRSFPLNLLNLNSGHLQPLL